MTEVVDGLSGVLGELVAALVVGVSERQIVDRAVMSMVDVLPISSAGVTLIAPGERPGIVAASSPDAMELERLQSELREGPCVIASRAQSACLSPDLASDGRFARYGPAAVKAGAAGAFAFPLRFRGTALGAIDLYRGAVGELSEGEIEAAQVISDAIAAFLANARWRGELEVFSAQLREIVGRDPLTGVLDRVLLVDRLDLALRRRVRSGREVGVVFVDLDDFKLINDRHGHQTGDQVLIAVAERLSRVLRPADSLARWGGDEFVIVCEELTDGHGLQELLARVYEQFAEAFTLISETLTVSASCGGVLSSEARDTPASLIDAADHAMYARKRSRDHDPPRPRSARRTGLAFRGTVTEPAATWNDWQEHWIEGPTPNAGAVALVVHNARFAELLITEFDQRVFVIARHQWLPIPPDAGHTSQEFELIITDWDDQPLQRRRVPYLPATPTSRDELTRVLDDLGLPR